MGCVGKSTRLVELQLPPHSFRLSFNLADVYTLVYLCVLVHARVPRQ